MRTHYAQYGYSEGESSHETRCGVDPEGEPLTRDPQAVTCVECKR